ncbi:MAG TPA: hypothetical protein VGE31_02000 [Candidatus Paceibacterota bacterium]
MSLVDVPLPEEATEHAIVRAYLAATENPPLSSTDAERLFSNSKLDAIRSTDRASYERWQSEAILWWRSQIHA